MEFSIKIVVLFIIALVVVLIIAMMASGTALNAQNSTFTVFDWFTKQTTGGSP